MISLAEVLEQVHTDFAESDVQSYHLPCTTMHLVQSKLKKKINSNGNGFHKAGRHDEVLNRNNVE